MSNPIRVGIRGAAGLLGGRIAQALAKSSDMKATIGVVIPDRSLQSMADRQGFLPEWRAQLPEEIFVHVPRHVGREADMVSKLNLRHDFGFKGFSQLSWRKNCDVIIDTAYPNGKDSVEDQYLNFPGHILLQDGATPEGRLIVPPLMGPEIFGERKYRMGDCILSGLIPQIYPFRNIAKKIRVSMLTQYNGRDSDYTIEERVNAVYVRDDLREKVEQDLKALFSEQEVEIEEVIQVPSLLHYKSTIYLELRREMSADEIRIALAEMPHVRVLPENVSSTYDINLARSTSASLPPITVFGGCIQVRDCSVRIVSALYYRQVAVLPNIDAVRILGRGMDPLEAMRQTDKEMGFIS